MCATPFDGATIEYHTSGPAPPHDDEELVAAPTVVPLTIGPEIDAACWQSSFEPPASADAPARPTTPIATGTASRAKAASKSFLTIDLLAGDAESRDPSPPTGHALRCQLTASLS